MINETIRDIVEKHIFYTETSDSPLGKRYTIPVDESTDFIIPNDVLREAFLSDDSGKYILSYIDECAFESITYQEDIIFDTIKEHLPAKAKYIIPDIEGDISEFISRYINFTVHDFIDRYFQQYYDTVIALDTGDAKHDFCDNNILNYADDGDKISESSAILYLTKQFGKEQKFHDAVNELRKADIIFEQTVGIEDNFVSSIINECMSNTCCCSAVTFLGRMTLSDICHLSDSINKHSDPDKELIIPKSTFCGLTDFFSGGGGNFNIELPSDLKIPYKYIYDVWPDGTKLHGYDPADIYGFTQEAYDVDIHA